MSTSTLSLSWLYLPSELHLLAIHLDTISGLCCKGKKHLHLDVIVQYDADLFSEVEISNSLWGSIDNENVRFLLLKGSGVAKSRNFAINQCRTKLIHFIDLDFRILNVDRYYKTVCFDLCDLISLAFIYPSSFSLSRYSLWCKIYHITNRKPLLPLHYMSKYWYTFFSAPTWCLIASVDFLKSNSIQFPEELGLGSLYQQSDEPVFIYRCCQVSQELVVKSTSSFTATCNSHASFSRRHIESKGYMFAITHRLYFFIFLPFFYMSIIYKKRPFNFLESLISFYLLLYGYLCGLFPGKINIRN